MKIIIKYKKGDYMEKFAQRLKELREEFNITQNQLSKKTQISQASISKWEKGKGSPNGEYLLILADFFNCSTDYLLGRVD